MHLTAAFETWRTHTKQILRSQSIVVRVLRHWAQRTSAAALEAWLFCSRQMLRSEKICRRVVEHLCRRTLSRALDAWRVRTGLFPLCLCVSVPAAYLAHGMQIRARARAYTRCHSYMLALPLPQSLSTFSQGSVNTKRWYSTKSFCPGAT
jgi:hypothetical protein